MTGDIVVDATAATAMDEGSGNAKVTKADTFAQAAPADFEWVDNGDGTSTLEAIEYVAQIGNNKYRTLEAAFAAAVDGDTITLLADCTGNGIKAPQGKFNTNGLTVNFNGHTYTVDGTLVGSTGTETQAFQLLKDNTITFQNGTIYSENAKMLIQNYSNLTLDNMTLTLDNPNYAYAYTLSNNNGNVVIDGTTINANPAGGFAFDVCRYASYPSVHVTVTGNSEINGNVEISASGNDAKDGFGLTLTSGTMTGDIVVDATAAAAMEVTPDKVEVTKANTFTQDAPADYEWVDNGNGTSELKAIEYVAQIGNNKYRTLEAAFAAVNDNDTITLIENIDLGEGRVTYNENKTITLDLGGKTLKGRISFFDGNVTVQHGTFEGRFDVYDSSNVTLAADATINGYALLWGDADNNKTPTFTVKGTVTGSDEYVLYTGGDDDSKPNMIIDTGAVINGNVGVFASTQATIRGTVNGYVAVIGSTDANTTLTNSPKLDVYGTINNTDSDSAAISTNGTDKLVSKITVYDGANVSSADIGIYLPSGNLTISGGTVTGKTAVYVKSGTVNITGGTLAATGAAADYSYNGNGANATGDAIVIDSCGYPGGAPTVTISGEPTFTCDANAKHIGNYVYQENVESAVTSNTNTLTLPEGQTWVQTGENTYEIHEFKVSTKWVNINNAYKAIFTYTCDCGRELEPQRVDPTYNDVEGIRTYTATDSYGNTAEHKHQITYTVTFGPKPIYATWGEMIVLSSPDGLPHAWYIDDNGTHKPENMVSNYAKTYTLIVTSNTNISIDDVVGATSENGYVRTTLTSTEAGKAVFNAKWTIPSNGGEITVESVKIYRGFTSTDKDISADTLRSRGTEYDTSLLVQHGDYTLKLSDLTSGKYQHVLIVIKYTINDGEPLYLVSNPVRVQVQ